MGPRGESRRRRVTLGGKERAGGVAVLGFCIDCEFAWSRIGCVLGLPADSHRVSKIQGPAPLGTNLVISWKKSPP